MSKFKAANDALSLLGKTALVVGGTQGIGAATACRFASLGASVTIVGRNQNLGHDVVLKMQSHAIQKQSQFFRFESLDVTSMRDVSNFCKSFTIKKEKDQGLDFLVLCAGGLNFGPRRETPEGVELTFAQNYLSRYAFTKELLPLLRRDQSTPGKVLNVLGAGNGSQIDMNDPQLKNGFWFGRAADQYAAMTDAITLEWNRRYNADGSSPLFFHLFPGIVNTQSAKNQGFPWIIHFPAQFFLPWIGKSPEAVAEAIVFAMTSDQMTVDHCLLKPDLAPIAPISCIEKGGQELRNKLWDYTYDLLNSILK